MIQLDTMGGAFQPQNDNFAAFAAGLAAADNPVDPTGGAESRSAEREG